MTRIRNPRKAVVLGSLVLTLCALQRSASAANFSVLYTFTGGNDGGYPVGHLIKDSVGNLYGTTEGGGSDACSGINDSGCGTIFKLAPDGTESILHALGGGSEGAYATGELSLDRAGNLFGTSLEEGDSNCFNGYGCGTVYKLAADGTFTVMHAFAGSPDDGAAPFNDGLLKAPHNAHIGVTEVGGSGSCSFGEPGCGTIYTLAKDGTETVLYSFLGGTDGAVPSGAPVADAAGNLYGITTDGGGSYTACTNGCGTVYEFAPDGTETVLYRFTDGTDGANPRGSGVVMDGSTGNLYGVTAKGGDSACFNGRGCGTVFQLAPDGILTTLHAFHGGSDGDAPFGGLVADTKGNLYGTTAEGGGTGCFGDGCGIVFKIASDGTETILYSFSGNSDGAIPEGALLSAGRYLYGTTAQGGGNGTECSGYGCGVVFKIRK